jgi:hypothetical protein
VVAVMKIDRQGLGANPMLNGSGYARNGANDPAAIIAIFMLYLPYIGSSRAAMWGLIGTSAWFVLGKSTHALGPLFLA